MIAIDTTFLIDLYWLSSPRHEAAVNMFNELADENGKYKDQEILVYYNCFNEFLHVITDTRRFEKAINMSDALEIVEQWRDLERLRIVFPDETSYVRTLTWLSIYELGRNRLNDTSMAACYVTQGASKLLTANPKDFEVFEVIDCFGY